MFKTLRLLLFQLIDVCSYAMIKQWWRKWKCVYDQNFRRRCESVLRPWTKHDTETKLFQSWFISKNCVGNMHQSCRNPNISYRKSPQHIPVDCLSSPPRISTQFQIFQIRETWKISQEMIKLNWILLILTWAEEQHQPENWFAEWFHWSKHSLRFSLNTECLNVNDML